MERSLIGKRCFWSIGHIIVSSALGCGTNNATDTPAFAYTELDMQQFIIGTWSGTWNTGDAGAAAVPFSLELHRPTSPGPQPLCVPREFASLHPQCIQVSQMNLAGVLNVSDGSFKNIQLSGQMSVPGIQLTQVLLDISDQANNLHVLAEWTADHWDLCRAEGPSGIFASCTLGARPSP